MIANLTQNYTLVLDMGSSGLRSLIAPADRPWALTFGVARRYRTHHPRDSDSLASHFAPDDLWRRVAGVLRDGVEAAGVAPEAVSRISITSQRQGVAFLANDGTAIYVGPNTDLRAVFEGAVIDDGLADEVYAITGHLPSLLLTPAKLHWWRHHHPRIFRRIRRILTLGAWVAYRLTGEQADVPTQLNEAGLAGVAAPQTPTLFAKLELDADLLPPTVDEGTPVGGLRAEAADATGLPPGTPVVLAGPDTQAALLGMGAAKPGDFGIVSGWSTPVQAITEQPIFDAQRRTWVGRHLLFDRWVAEASAGDTGGTLDMVRRILGPRASINRLAKLVSHSRLGSNLVTAFWGPHALDLAHPGVSMGGLLTPVPITYNAVHAGHIVRATMENIAYAIRECVELLVQVTGHEPRSIGLSGGLAQDPLFPQLLADVLGVRIRRHHHRASAIGAAMAASVPRSQWEGAARQAAVQGIAIEPDIRGAMEYAELYQRWLRLKGRLQELENEL
jgi:sugar (pentulose or hexulose) kinase